MPDLPTPRATRLRRPSWRDARLVGGLVIVLLATVIGAKVVASADDTVPVYAAATLLKPGDELTESSVARVDVLLGDGAGHYLGAAEPLAPGQFALREVRAGELVPRSAVGGREAVGVQPVTVDVDALSASALVVGSVVDVYVSARDDSTTQERYERPERMLSAVTVSWLPTQDRFGAGPSTSAVQVLVPTAKVPELLAAVDQQARVALVPVPGSPRESGS